MSLQEAIAPVHPPVGQHDGVVLDVAFGVVGVGQVAGQLVEFGGADGTYGAHGREG